MRSGRLLWLATLIALPLLISLAGMLWGSARILDGIAVSVNQVEEDRSWQAVKSAVSSTLNRVSGLAMDNAHWNDPIAHVYGEFDTDWVTEMWGDFTGDGNYDVVIIVTPAGETLASFALDGQPRLSAREFFGDQLPKIIASLPQDNATFESVQTLTASPLGLVFVAAGPLVPTDPEIKVPAPRANIIMFGRYFSAETQAALSAEYAVDDLRVEPLESGAVSSGYVLHDTWGRPVAKAMWTPRLPGDAAKSAYVTWVAGLIVVLLGAMLPVAGVLFATLRRLDSQERNSFTQARTDALSQLPNRVHLIEELTIQLATRRRDGAALLFIDLDGFKAVNDAYDHDTGDRLISAFAARLRGLVAVGDMAARLGGDEFAVVVKGADCGRRAQELARQIIREVSEPFNLDGRVAAIGASVGIAVLVDETLDPAEFMRRADVAMYDAKSSGRNTWRTYDSTLDRKRAEDFQAAMEIRRILEQGGFEVVYRPIVAAGGRAIEGVEAEARWPDTSSRQLAPADFTRVAAEHGLIDKLGAQVMETVCRDLAAFDSLTVTVRVASAQLDNPNLVKDIETAAGRHGFAKHRLELELVEEDLLRKPAKAKQTIAALHAAGFAVALGDFGTGYASFGHLRGYPFKKIRLDPSLTRDVTGSRDLQSVVQGTILIAKGLSFDVVAEGVESEDEAKMLHLAGCRQMQGEHFGGPLALPRLLNALRMSGQGHGTNAGQDQRRALT